MKTTDFDFDLPEDRIALRPADPRDSARLLVVSGDALEDRIVRDLPDFLRPGDALVFNDTRVIPARLSGVRQRVGPEGETLTVEVEATLHHRDAPDVWSAFMKPGKRIKPGDRIRFGAHGDAACDLGRLDATVTAKGDDGLITLDWLEHGGPIVAPPTRSGFGSRLIDVSIRNTLAGSASMDYADGRLHCRLTFRPGAAPTA